MRLEVNNSLALAPFSLSEEGADYSEDYSLQIAPLVDHASINTKFFCQVVKRRPCYAE